MKIKNIVAICLAMIIIFTMAGCSRIGSIVMNQIQNFKNKSTAEETITVKSPDTNKFYVKNETGSIYVNRVDGDSVKVRLVKTVYSSTEQGASDMLQNIKPYAEVRDGRFEIGSVMKDTGEEFWSWKNKNRDRLNASIDYYIDIPKDFEEYSVEEVTGNIELRSLKGTFYVKNVTGDIRLNNVGLYKNNTVSLVTGNISLSANLDNATNLDVNNTTGDITLAMPSISKVSVDARITTGSIGGSFINSSTSALGKGRFSGDFNGGGTKVNVQLITGNININNK